MLAGFVRCNGGLDNGTALSSLAGRRGQIAPAPRPHHRRRAERVRRGALIVAQVRAGAAAAALPLSVAIEIGRPRDDRERKATPVVASAPPAHRGRCGGVVAPSRQLPRSMPPAFGAEARRPPPQTAEIAGGRQHNCSRETMAVAARTPSTPSRGPDCPTACRSPAKP
jgi:hypothetical protein